jgi:hypothetical protein
MSKLRFSNYQAKQSRIVEGVCVPISDGVGDYDELLREAVRVALRTDMNPARDDWDDLYDHVRTLMAAYIASPEGEGEDACTLMARRAICVADVIPMAIRKGLIIQRGTRFQQARPDVRGAGRGALKRYRSRGDQTVRVEHVTGNSLPVTCCTRKEKMPNAWRGAGQRSSTGGQKNSTR